jgi:hypothetical protein
LVAGGWWLVEGVLVEVLVVVAEREKRERELVMYLNTAVAKVFVAGGGVGGVGGGAGSQKGGRESE